MWTLIGTKFTFYLKCWVTSNIVYMYVWVVTTEIKYNKVSDQLIESPTKQFTVVKYADMVAQRTLRCQGDIFILDLSLCCFTSPRLACHTQVATSLTWQQYSKQHNHLNASNGNFL